MMLKTPIQETSKMVGFYGKDVGELMVMDEKIYVAVNGKDLESKSSLVWAIENSRGKMFCIVYVHQPIQSRFYRKEKERVHKNLDKYLHICRQMQVIGEKIYIEKDSVEEGILQLISQRGVRKLVMGAAADRHYSMRMRDLQSKKAIYIRQEAASTCHIWFTCNGYLICSREAKECISSSSLSKSAITNGDESVPSSSMVKDDDRINELKCRKETEKALREAKEELKKMRLESETRIIESNKVIRMLQGEYNLALKALRRLREEQEELKIELSEVLKLKSKREEEEEVSYSKDHEPPKYFICPITQDVMKDPHVAADGFTYEGEAISGWFERGQETSPMTNKRVSHTSLVPNLALRSAIQEWLQASSS